MPSAIRRSANSDTMMASSTSMPTARMSENSTTMLMVRPGELQPEHAREERGRDGDADEQRGAEAEREQDDDDDQQDAVATRVLQVGEHLPDVLRLVLREGDVDARAARSASAARSTAFTPSTVSIRFAPVRLDTSMVMAGLPLTRVMEVGSLNVGCTCATSPSVTVAPADAATGKLEDVGRLLDQRRHLDGEPAGLALERAGGDQAVARPANERDELIERQAVALHQHRLGDDLDHLVARAAQLRRKHARHLLDGVLGLRARCAAACAPARRRRAPPRAPG